MLYWSWKNVWSLLITQHNSQPMMMMTMMLTTETTITCFATRKTRTCTCNITFRNTISLHVTSMYTFRFRFTSQRERWQTETSIPANVTATVHSTRSQATMNAHRAIISWHTVKGAIGHNYGSLIIQFLFLISDWDGHVEALSILTGYTWKSRRVTCSLQWTML